jgi:predicted  nucleic acid-binding Zn-ribbon protein
MDQARILLELQDRDLRIFRLNKQLDEMPEKRAILAARAKLAEIAKLLARTDSAGRAIDAQISRLDDEMTAIRLKMEHEQAKLLSGEVKNPKELTAISMELDSLKRRLDKLEGEELAQMAKRETATAQSGTVSAALVTGREREAEMVSAFKARGGDLLAEVKRLTAERATLAGALPVALRERYDAVRAAKHAVAVGNLEGDMCGVCRVNIPAGELEKLQAGPEIGRCPMCQRILIVRAS